jgi:hypothetical protein
MSQPGSAVSWAFGRWSPAGVLLADTRVSPVALLAFARLLLRLQEARHDADYDHVARFPKAVALIHVAEARRAVELLATHAQDDDFRLIWAVIASDRRR